jgi:death-on-curing family protein
VIKYLSYNTVVALNAKVGGPGAGVINPEGIRAQLGRAHSSSHGAELFDTVWSKAAVILQGVASTQYFSDGNKRTAWVAAIVFLGVNGHTLRDTPDVEAEAFVLAVATGLFNVNQAAEWLEGRRLTAADRKDFAFLALNASISDGSNTFEAQGALAGGITVTELPLIVTIAVVAHIRWVRTDVNEKKAIRVVAESPSDPAVVVSPTRRWLVAQAKSPGSMKPPVDSDIQAYVQSEQIPFSLENSKLHPDGVFPFLWVDTVTLHVRHTGVGALRIEIDGELFARMPLHVSLRPDWDGLSVFADDVIR